MSKRDEEESRWYGIARRGLFRMDAERAHERVMKGLTTFLGPAWARRSLAGRISVDSPKLRTRLWGLDFPNPLGMAAGFDKDGKYFNALGALNFGHVEIGTVTGVGQAGNPKPRLFRLVEDQALLNRMGFNNAGSEAMARRLEKGPIEPILGINLGKSKVVELEDAAEDYAASLRRLYEFADYIVINVSSPNTPGLRRLQGRERLSELLGFLQDLNGELAASREIDKRPLLLKISPDLSEGALDDVLSVVDEKGIDGIVATNTTISREGLRHPDVDGLGPGGVSGRPLTERSRDMVARIYGQTGGAVPIVGVGGVFDARDAMAMFEAGASLVQIWTGFVYGGPLIVRDILQGLLERLDEEGLDSISEVVGRGHQMRESIGDRL